MILLSSEDWTWATSLKLAPHPTLYIPQRAVILFSSEDWTWATRVADTRTLWGVWSGAVATLRRHESQAKAANPNPN